MVVEHESYRVHQPLSVDGDPTAQDARRKDLEAAAVLVMSRKAFDEGARGLSLPGAFFLDKMPFLSIALGVRAFRSLHLRRPLDCEVFAIQPGSD